MRYLQNDLHGWVAVAVSLCCCLLTSAGEEKAGKADRKPYALFEGMDLQARTKEGVFPIVAFTNKRITIARNGTRDPLSAKSEISYAIRTKLSDKWVDLDVVEIEPFYNQPDTERSVTVVFKDLPEGFSLLGLDVHVYSRGEEIPTRYSSKLKMMTEDEAFSYSLTQHKESKGPSKPTLFRSLRAEAITALLSEKEILSIQADLIVHQVGSTSVDFLNTRNRPIAEKLVQLLEDVRFIPAMLDGHPMESKVSMPLSTLVD